MDGSVPDPVRTTVIFRILNDTTKIFRTLNGKLPEKKNFPVGSGRKIIDFFDYTHGPDRIQGLIGSGWILKHTGSNMDEF